MCESISQDNFLKCRTLKTQFLVFFYQGPPGYAQASSISNNISNSPGMTTTTTTTRKKKEERQCGAAKTEEYRVRIGVGVTSKTGV